MPKTELHGRYFWFRHKDIEDKKHNFIGYFFYDDNETAKIVVLPSGAVANWEIMMENYWLLGEVMESDI